MKAFRFALIVLVVGVGFALYSGGDWQKIALGGLFGALLAAMNETMPLLDWLYPKDEGDKPHVED